MRKIQNEFRFETVHLDTNRVDQSQVEKYKSAKDWLEKAKQVPATAREDLEIEEKIA